VGAIVVPIIGLLGLIVCLVGVLISMPFASLWQYLVTAHLYGQIGAYGNRPVRTPVAAPIPSLPSEYYDEMIPSEPPATPERPATGPEEEAASVEGLIVPKEAAAPVPETVPVEAPAPETPAAPEPPIEPAVTEETQ
jgi:hypothetical protein